MDARVRVGARRAAFLNSFPSPFAGRAKEMKQKAHREKETPDVRKFTHSIFFSKPRADDQDGARRVRCTACPSAVGGARRCTNAFSRCGLSHCGDSPSSAAHHGILFSLHVELKHALRAGAHGMAAHCARKEQATAVAADSGACTLAAQGVTKRLCARSMSLFRLNVGNRS